MVGVIESFRAGILRTTAIPWDLLGVAYLVGSLLLISGILFFKKKESIFADVA